jgi:alpha-L-arabinofuranosidase
MEMYKVHQDAQLLPLDLKTEQYQLGNEKLPAISASASKDKTGQVNLSIVNVDANQKRTVNIDLPGLNGKTITGRILTAPKLQAHNTFEQPTAVQPTTFREFKVQNGQLQVVVPPFSVVVLGLK